MEQSLGQTGEIVMYQPDETIRLEVRMEDESVWLNRQQMASLFDRDVKTIGKHINNALKEELRDLATVAKFAIVQPEGKRMISRLVEFYNLDMVLSVGYRVKSQKGILFRQWANQILKDYLLRGYAVNKRMELLEQRVTRTEEKIDFFVRTSLPPSNCCAPTISDMAASPSGRSYGGGLPRRRTRRRRIYAPSAA
ncbi:MAG: virulence RhuM family protein [Prevotella sp.]|nr:virulence RhuM family protein [Prevotella sp.]